LRRRARDAVLSGFHDAMQAIEQGDPAHAYFVSAQQIEQMLADVGQRKISTTPEAAASPLATAAQPPKPPVAPVLPSSGSTPAAQGNSYDARLAAAPAPPTPSLPGLGPGQPVAPPRRGRPRNDQPR
jgi:hypothetical protein